MTEDAELYTDYALQIFSSYLQGDSDSLMAVFDSLKDDKQDENDLFLPGLSYGMMYHLAKLFHNISDMTGIPVDKLLQAYAMDYAVDREDLLDNPLLNAKKSQEALAEVIKQYKEQFGIEEEE